MLDLSQIAPKIQAKGLLFVEMTRGKDTMRPMVNANVYHNFIFIEEALRLGVKVNVGGDSIKVVKSTTQPIYNTFQEVKNTMGTWYVEMDSLIILMDNYRVILEVDFLDQIKTFSMLFANNLCLLRDDKVCMMPITRIT